MIPVHFCLERSLNCGFQICGTRRLAHRIVTISSWHTSFSLLTAKVTGNLQWWRRRIILLKLKLLIWVVVTIMVSSPFKSHLVVIIHGILGVSCCGGYLLVWRWHLFLLPSSWLICSWSPSLRLLILWIVCAVTHHHLVGVKVALAWPPYQLLDNLRPRITHIILPTTTNPPKSHLFFRHHLRILLIILSSRICCPPSSQLLSQQRTSILFH